MAKDSGNDRDGISELTTGRLSVYLRCLTFLETQGVKTVSSHQMATRFHLNSAQMRKDLACFGEFGTRGVGYDVPRLKQQLVETLGLDRIRTVIIAGAGNLGMALADYGGFNSNGFRIVAMIDTDPGKSGRVSREGIPVHPWEKLSSIVLSNRIDIGIIAVPPDGAQAVYDALADAGVQAVLNFAPVQLKLRSAVKVKSVDLRINLESLSFYLKKMED